MTVHGPCKIVPSTRHARAQAAVREVVRNEAHVREGVGLHRDASGDARGAVEPGLVPREPVRQAVLNKGESHGSAQSRGNVRGTLRARFAREDHLHHEDFLAVPVVIQSREVLERRGPGGKRGLDREAELDAGHGDGRERHQAGHQDEVECHGARVQCDPGHAPLQPPSPKRRVDASHVTCVVSRRRTGWRGSGGRRRWLMRVRNLDPHQLRRPAQRARRGRVERAHGQHLHARVPRGSRTCFEAGIGGTTLIVQDEGPEEEGGLEEGDHEHRRSRGPTEELDGGHVHEQTAQQSHHGRGGRKRDGRPRSAHRARGARKHGRARASVEGVSDDDHVVHGNAHDDEDNQAGHGREGLSEEGAQAEGTHEGQEGGEYAKHAQLDPRPTRVKRTAAEGDGDIDEHHHEGGGDCRPVVCRRCGRFARVLRGAPVG
mmetsp:Transcript_4819/g.13982  ORF Transcript_4819/g.13982 Transcript_4819/m.13982 type:complete len:431 (-) Transcript_4819:816-2108(-)